jgi:hypothetical protein
VAETLRELNAQGKTSPKARRFLAALATTSFVADYDAAEQTEALLAQSERRRFDRWLPRPALAYLRRRFVSSFLPRRSRPERRPAARRVVRRTRRSSRGSPGRRSSGSEDTDPPHTRPAGGAR